MFKRLRRGWRYTLVILRAWPAPARRSLLRRMIQLSRALPGYFDQPLPTMLAQLTPTGSIAGPFSPDEIRQLADAVAAWHWRSPLGLCLRRSLLRYHFLRQAGTPVRLVFGARLKEAGEGGGLGGHAWLTLAEAPYYENPADYEGFVVMYRYPPDSDR